jgi:hypothetical protein
MGLMDEYKKGRDWIATTLNFQGVCFWSSYSCVKKCSKKSIAMFLSATHDSLSP